MVSKINSQQLIKKLADPKKMKVIAASRNGELWTSLPDDNEMLRYLKLVLALRRTIRCVACGRTVEEAGFGSIMFSKEDMSDGVFICMECQYKIK
ncbi:MAG: hypothetical protein ABWK05_07065 [Pyrobaculum sp.]